MSVDPVETENVGGRRVERYDLPIHGDYPILTIDLRPDGYTAEWDTDINLDKFASVVERHIPGEFWDKEGTATVEPVDCQGAQKEGTVGELLEDGYEDDCTYFLIKSEGYDIGWEEWEKSNTIILTVEGHDLEPLSTYYNKMVPHFVSEKEVEDALHQVRKIL